MLSMYPLSRLGKTKDSDADLLRLNNLIKRHKNVKSEGEKY